MTNEDDNVHNNNENNAIRSIDETTNSYHTLPYRIACTIPVSISSLEYCLAVFKINLWLP